MMAIPGARDEDLDQWAVCACDHYRAEHPGVGHCEVIIIMRDGSEKDCVCRAFRFARKRRG